MFVGRLESGKRGPSEKIIKRLAKVLGFDARTLFFLVHPHAHTIPDLSPANPVLSTRKRFKNDNLLRRFHNISDAEMEMLSQVASLGEVRSAREERVVRNDNTVGYHNLILQLPPSRYRAHFVRCPVTVHQFSNGQLGISYQGRLLARYHRDGELLHPAASKVRAASAQPPGQPTDAVPAAATHWRTPSRLTHFPARTPQASEGADGKMSISQTANSTSGGDSPCPAAPL